MPIKKNIAASMSSQLISPEEFNGRLIQTQNGPDLPVNSTFQQELEKMGYVDVMQIDEGGFSRIYRAKNARAEIVVLKRIILAKTADEPLNSKFNPIAIIERTNEEYQAMRAIGEKPFIITLKRCFGLFRSMVFELPYINGVTLALLINQQYPEPFLKETALNIIAEILCAVEAIHAAGYVHCDLSPKNVMLVNENNSVHVVIIDFGAARFMGKKVDQTTYCRETTSGFGAPELSSAPRHHFYASADYYSVGVIFHLLLTGKMPFFECPEDGNGQTSLSKNIKLEPQTYEILSRLLEPDETSRIDSTDCRCTFGCGEYFRVEGIDFADVKKRTKSCLPLELFRQAMALRDLEQTSGIYVGTMGVVLN